MRSVPAADATILETANRSPDSHSSWAPGPRQASAIDGADSPATSSTATEIWVSARPTAGLPSSTTIRTSARSLRTSSAVSSVCRSLSWVEITAAAPARPAAVSASADRGLASSRGTPQPAMTPARPGSGRSSTTTAGTPDRLSSSTIRRPTPCSPHTITCPRQLLYASVMVRGCHAPGPAR